MASAWLLACVLGSLGGCGAVAAAATPAEPPVPATSAPAVARVHPTSCEDPSDPHDSLELRAQAAAPVRWALARPAGGTPREPAQRASGRPSQERRQSGTSVSVKLLAINDFHGQLSSRNVATRRAGGAAVLGAYLKTAAARSAHAFIVHAGDHVGASPPSSALLQDEPAIGVLNLLGNAECRYRGRSGPRCNLVGTFGNHEFDEGWTEIERLLGGGNHPSGPFLEDPWRGARFPYVSANVIDSATGRPIVPPYVIKRARGIPIAFVGAVLRGTPAIVTPSGVAGLRFVDEAEAINRYVPELHAQGVRAIIVSIHQGLTQARYEGPTAPQPSAAGGALLEIVHRLDDDIDVVVSGHTHQFSNAIVPNARGAPLLVSQAFSAGTAFAEIDLVLDPHTRDVVSKTARIVTAWADEGPGLRPDRAIAALVARADARVAPRVDQAVAEAAAAISSERNEAGESALGNLIADAQRAAVGADFAIMNSGGIRAEIDPGRVSWGELFAIHPFGNNVLLLRVTGQQIYALLNQQWGGIQPPGGRVLQISGFRYLWDSRVPEGGPRVVEVRDAAGPLSPTASYTLAANSYLAGGGDGFTALEQAEILHGGPVDLDALSHYLKALPQPFRAAIEGRISRR